LLNYLLVQTCSLNHLVLLYTSTSAVYYRKLTNLKGVFLPYVVETYNLTKRFPITRGYWDLLSHPFRKKETTALRNANIKVKKGELFGLLGPNGAGKTTLIKILSTLVLPTSGKAFVNGLEVTKDDKKIRKKIGYVVSDERSFYWRLTGRQNLQFFARLNNLSNREENLRIKKLLHFFGLINDADRMFKDYSKGMKQKLAIVRGLLTDPELILMDEPNSSLDPLTAQSLRKLIREKLIEEEKRTVVLATHNLKEAEELCDRIAIIKKGEVKEVGSLEEIKKKFNSDKRYLIEIENTEEDLIERIHTIASIKKVIPISNDSFNKKFQIEVEITSNNESIPKIIKKIMGIGGNISSIYKKDTSLKIYSQRL